MRLLSVLVSKHMSHDEKMGISMYKNKISRSYRSTLSLVSLTLISLVGCHDNQQNAPDKGGSLGDSESAENPGNNFQVSGDVFAQGLSFIPSKSAHPIEVTVYYPDGDPLANRDLILSLEGEQVQFVESNYKQSVSITPHSRSLSTTMVSTDNKGAFITYVQSTRAGPIRLLAHTTDAKKVLDYQFSYDVSDTSDLTLELNPRPVSNDVLSGNGSMRYEYEFTLSDVFGNPYPEQTINANYDESKITVYVAATDSNGQGSAFVVGDGQQADIPFALSYSTPNQSLQLSSANNPEMFVSFSDPDAFVSSLVDDILPSNDQTSSDLLTDAINNAGNISEITESNGKTVIIIEKTNGEFTEVTFEQQDPSTVAIDDNLGNGVIEQPSYDANNTTQLVITETDQNGTVTQTTDTIVSSPNGNPTSISEVVVQDADGQLIESTTTVTGEDSTGESITVVSEYKSDGQLEGDTTLPMTEGLSGELVKSVVTNNSTGSIEETSRLVSTQSDGSEIVAEHSKNTHATSDNAIASIGGELTGAVESISVTQTDTDGNLVKEQSITSGSNSAGDTIVAESQYDVAGMLDVDGSSIEGKVSNSQITTTDSSNTVTTENVSSVLPENGGDLIVTPPTATFVPDGMSPDDVVPQNTPINGNATEATINSLALTFEQLYGVNFKGWDVNKLVVPYIMRDVMDYDKMLTMLKNKGGDELKHFMQNYPISSSNGFINLLSIAGQHTSLLTYGNKADNSKEEVLFGSRIKSWRYLSNLIVNDYSVHSKLSMLSLENGRTYIANGTNLKPKAKNSSGGLSAAIPDAISEAGLTTDYYGNDSDGNIYFKHVSSTAFASKTNHTRDQGAQAYLLLTPPNMDNKLVCVALAQDESITSCRNFNALNQDPTIEWYGLISQPEAVAESPVKEKQAVTTEGEYGNKAFILTNKGSYYVNESVLFYEGVQVAQDAQLGKLDESNSWLMTNGKLYIYGSPYAYNELGDTVELDTYSTSGKTHNYAIPSVQSITKLHDINALQVNLDNGDVKVLSMKGADDYTLPQEHQQRLSVARTLLAKWNSRYATSYTPNDIAEYGNLQWSYKFKDGSLALFDTLPAFDSDGSQAQPLEDFERFIGKKLLASSQTVSGTQLTNSNTGTPVDIGLNISGVLKFDNGLYWTYTNFDRFGIQGRHDDGDYGLNIFEDTTYAINMRYRLPETSEDLSTFAMFPEYSDNINRLNRDYGASWTSTIYGLHLNPEYAFGSQRRLHTWGNNQLLFSADINSLGFYDFNVFAYNVSDYENSNRHSYFVDNTFDGADGKFAVPNVISATSHLGYWTTMLAFYHYDNGQFKTQIVATHTSDYTSDCLEEALSTGASQGACQALE